jgi:hypothetical protein
MDYNWSQKEQFKSSEVHKTNSSWYFLFKACNLALAHFFKWCSTIENISHLRELMTQTKL